VWINQPAGAVQAKGCAQSTRVRQQVGATRTRREANGRIRDGGGPTRVNEPSTQLNKFQMLTNRKRMKP